MRIYSILPVWVILLSLSCISAWGGVVITPSHTNLSYRGKVVLAAPVGQGASADIDIFFDNNRNATIDAGEVLWRHYTVTDGQAVPPTGAMLVTDSDGSANGSLNVPIMNYDYDDRIAGYYVVRVKSGSNTAQAAFINDPPSAAQSISGQLRLGGVGKPGAVFLLDSGGGMLYPVLTDISGNYTLPVPAAGNYQVGGMIVGEAASLHSGVAVTLAANQKKTGVNVNYTVSAWRLQGKVVRSDNSAAIPYAWLDIDNESNGGWIGGVADSAGNFNIAVPDGTWKVRVAGKEQRGYVTGSFPGNTNYVTINGANLAGKIYSLTPLAGFVTGRARNSSTLAWLAGAKLVFAMPGSYNWEASATSDANGYWALGLCAGKWDVYPQLDDEFDLYKTLLYPNKRFTKTVALGQAPQDIGTLDFLPAEGNVAVKVVDPQGNPQAGLYLFGTDMGVANGYLSNAGATGSNGVANVPLRRNNTWYVGVVIFDPRVSPPLRRLDVLAQGGNVITLYPQGYRRRPYRVFGGNSFPANTDYPQDSGFRLLGQAAGTATFTGAYSYYCIVTCDGECLVDAIRGSNGVYFSAVSASQTLNVDRLIGAQDRQYTTIGDNGGNPAVGSVCIHPGPAVSGITVIHPDAPYTAARGWRLYELP